MWRICSAAFEAIVLALVRHARRSEFGCVACWTLVVGNSARVGCNFVLEETWALCRCGARWLLTRGERYFLACSQGLRA